MNARSREALVEVMSAGVTPRFLPFWGHELKGRGPGPWVLSQWFPAPFTVDGVRYPTAEHWMMAGKAELFGDDEMLEAILTSRDPGRAKALGRRVRGFEPSAWGERSFDVVVEGNVHKFAQDPELRAYLLRTEDAVLVEASPRDVIWGIGLGPKNPKVEAPAMWRGRNLLGFALMEARARLRAD